MVPTLTGLSSEAGIKRLGSFGEFPRIVGVEWETPSPVGLSTRSQFREVPLGFRPLHYFHYSPALIFHCSAHPPNYVRGLSPVPTWVFGGKEGRISYQMTNLCSNVTVRLS